MKLVELTWPDVDALSRDIPVIIPIAALEQHGRHMPVFTDSMLMGEVARRAEQTLADQTLFAPLQWLGNSHHHLDFPGTMSAQPRLYIDLLQGLVENFLHHGFRRILLINGHGGNDVPGKQAIFELRQKYRERMDLLLLFATYWHLAPGGKLAHAALEQPEMGHAGEWETSMVLRLSPQLVKEHRNVPDVSFGVGFSPASRGWTMRDRSAPGHIGRPSLATAEKGESLFAHFAEGLEALLARMIAWDGSSWDS